MICVYYNGSLICKTTSGTAELARQVGYTRPVGLPPCSVLDSSCKQGEGLCPVSKKGAAWDTSVVHDRDQHTAGFSLNAGDCS